MIRTGLYILATVGGDTLETLHAIARDVPAGPGPDLRDRVRADHRAGRTVRVGGVSLSVTEAAWCLKAAEDAAGNDRAAVS